LESERQVFPLTGRYARQFAAHRLALVGDAAHTIHPLAGQGVNQGKDVLSNFFSGIMLYFDRPFSIGDWIRSPDRNIEGTVAEIGW
ncbi:mechanosensitive ion channel, partial [Salmonella enterica subsp. enterica serovar Anatum]|nr:mechanosensitive ion channel [Salmonella enterica subsp. enterica serovar Anatum]